mmetsp:Transcript_27151/g.34859  ORF Transcript_27151/g.34859 Transcript_27151/m.34859 type:complete len:120 (+) Transcript_27151:376-735(+)|eukprot:scaffold24375_cov136-Skeletonema_marinoi.AAC.1
MSAAHELVLSDEIVSAVDAIQGEATEFLKTIVAIDSTLDKGEEEVQTTILKLLQETLGSGADVEASGAKSTQPNCFDEHAHAVKQASLYQARKSLKIYTTPKCNSSHSPLAPSVCLDLP